MSRHSLSSSYLGKTTLPVFIAEHDAVWYGISLWPICVSCAGCVPSQLLAYSQPTYWWWWGRARNREDLDTMQALFSNY